MGGKIQFRLLPFRLMPKYRSNTFWKKRRVFVTGATGFLGSWLTKMLVAKGAEVTVLVRNQNRPSDLFLSGTNEKISLVIGAVEEFPKVVNALATQKSEIIFHLASTNINRGNKDSPLNIFETNVRGTYNIVEAYRSKLKNKGCLITASSSEVLKSSIDAETELDGKVSEHPYSVSKKCAEMISKTFRNAYNTNVITIRLPNVYGGGDFNRARIVPSVIYDILQNRNPVIKTEDNLSRRYVYVEDLVRALLLVAEHHFSFFAENAEYEFHRKEAILTIDLVKRIIAASGQTHLYPAIQARTNVHHTLVKQKQLQYVEDLGWSPEIPLGEGLSRALDWYRNYLEQTSLEQENLVQHVPEGVV